MKKGSQLVNQLLVVIGSIFVVILVVMAAVSIYLSIGGSNKSAAYQGFYSGESAAVSSASDPAATDATADTTTTDDSSSDTSGTTIAVLAGEGEAAIAARAGISIAELERLNPQHMTTGSWYADPGDMVNIQ